MYVFPVWQTLTPKGFPNFLSSLVWQPWINFVWNRRFIAFESLWFTYLLYILNPKFRWHLAVTLLINSLWEYPGKTLFLPTDCPWLLIFLTFSFNCNNPTREPFRKDDCGCVGCERLTVRVVRFTALPMLPPSISGLLKPEHQKNFQVVEWDQLDTQGPDSAPVALALVYGQSLEKCVFQFSFRRSWNHTSMVHPGSRLRLCALGPGTGPDGRSAVREAALARFSSLWAEASSRDLASSDPSLGNSTQICCLSPVWI